VVNILDALGILYDGSGAHYGNHEAPKQIAASRDPVMLDTYGLELINDYRRQNGLNDILLSDSDEQLATPQWVWPGGCNEDGYINAAHLVVASQDPFQLGSTDTQNRVERDVTNDVGTASVPVLATPQSRVLSLHRHRSGWTLAVQAELSGRLHRLQSRLIDLTGREVRSFASMNTRSPEIQLEWDGRTASGSTVAHGIYSWEVRVDGRRHTVPVHHR
jgi:hypothetical protein